MADVRGHADEGWGPVADAFRANFEQRGEVGAAVAIVHEGRKVVDLWGGVADVQTGRAWDEGTLVTVFSTTKGLVAACFLMLVDRGRLDLEAPVAQYWPELGPQLGSATVRMLLNHRAGTSVIDAPVSGADFDDPARVARLLEAEPQKWPADTIQGYGGTAWGMYCGELFRRVTGESVGRFFDREIRAPLGLSTWIGLPPSEDARVARLVPLSAMDRLRWQVPAMLTRTADGAVFRNVAFKRSSFTRRAFQNPRDVGPDGFDVFHRPETWRRELPWVNGITDARSLARMYGAFALGGSIDGVTLVKPATLAPLRERQSWGIDAVMCKPMGYAQGFTKEEPHLFSPNPASFGHAGTGGSIGWCDPDRKFGLGYVMNRHDWRIRSPRCIAICQAAAAACDRLTAR